MGIDLLIFMSCAAGGVLLWWGTSLFRQVPEAAAADADEFGFHERRLPGWMKFMALAFPQLPVELRRIRRDTLRAGRYETFAVERFLARRNSILWGIILVTFLVSGLLPEAAMLVWMLGGAVAGAFYGLPGLFLHLVGDTRARRIVDSVPDTLDILSMCLSGGLTVEQSLDHLADYLRNTHPEFHRELQIVIQQSVASSPGEAFERMAERLDEGELRSLSAIVRQTERLGTSLAAAFDQLSREIRAATRHRAEARANSMALKLLFPVIFCVTPPVFFVLMVPPIVSIRDHFNSELFDFDAAEEIMSTPSDLIDVPD
jgi:tight adherence protein C